MPSTNESPPDRQALLDQLEETLTSFEDRMSMLDELLAAYEPLSTEEVTTSDRVTRLEGDRPDTAWIHTDTTVLLTEWQ